MKRNNNTVAVRGRGDKNVEEGACGDTTDGMVIDCDEVKKVNPKSSQLYFYSANNQGCH